jgi:hypothetical protein
MGAQAQKRDVDQWWSIHRRVSVDYQLSLIDPSPGSRSASLKSCSSSCGARFEKAYAKSRFMCGSNSSHTDRHYCSASTCSTPFSRSQVERWHNSVLIVENRRLCLAKTCFGSRELAEAH